MTGPESDAPGLARPELVRVLESAARLQEVVPDAVLVGGSAAALWANHASPMTTTMCWRISVIASTPYLKRSKQRMGG
jgi:hypothetical protein